MDAAPPAALRLLLADRVAGSRPALGDDEAGQVERARHDRNAFAELYRAHYAAIGAYVFRRCGDVHATEDLLSEVFLAALRALPSFQIRDVPFRAWLYRIATHAVNRWVRREGRRPAELVAPDALIDERTGGRGECDVADERAWMQRCLRELAPAQQSVLALHYVEGFTVEEVARTLRCRPGTVKSRLARGRAALERVLSTRRKGS